MLESLYITNFKGFRSLELRLRPLTLLSGLNGMGKSSVLQSMLLLRQSYLQRSLVTNPDRPRLVLNGDLVQLGTAEDVFFKGENEGTLTFSIVYSGEQFTWSYLYQQGSNALRLDSFRPSTLFSLDELSLFSDEFQYLQAERLGPRVSYEMSDYLVRERQQLGSKGEYTAHFLQYWTLNADTPRTVSEAMHHPNEKSPLLLNQVTAWMSEISPGTRIETTPIEGTDLMRLRFGFGNSELFRPTNVGFGITYTLPVIVALLSSQPQALVLIENPEAHLHPKGQAKMGELVSRAANSGVQVILETHSDHILNGIRIAARNRLIDAQNVALHYFQRDKEPGAGTKVESPRLSQEGRLDAWPEGFFDEWDNSLDALM